MTRAAANEGLGRDGRGPRAFPHLVAVLAVVISGCAAVAPSALDSAAGLVAQPGEIVLSCHGIESSAVDDEPLARGHGEYKEARAIEGIPAELWLAVLGDLPCRPSMGEPLLYEWYLAGSTMSTQADREEWGERVASLTLPLSRLPSAEPAAD